MKTMKVALATAASALLLASPALAFHDGGVANCEGCHTMHNSLGGTVMNGKYSLTQGVSTQYQTGKFLLQGTTQSEACLNCHESTPGSYHISTPTAGYAGASANGKIAQFTPGGDFRWLTLTTVGSSKNGHSIVAPAYGYTADVKNAPGPDDSREAYPAASLACSSCHDPHGKYRRTSDTAVASLTGGAIVASGSYGNSVAPSATEPVGAYRLLPGVGYIPKSMADAGKNVAFLNDSPIAVAPSTYNVSETTLGGIRVAYGSGMSEWCSNCHAKMHTASYTSGQSGAGTVHPAGVALGATIAGNYNAYVTSADKTGVQGSAWNNLVPFETGGTDFSALRTLALNNDQTGPTAASKVMCLSCHRAHATGFNSMLRFPATSTLIAEGNAYVPDTRGNGAMLGTANDIQTALGNRDVSLFGTDTAQRALCNKCHNKD